VAACGSHASSLMKRKTSGLEQLINPFFSMPVVRATITCKRVNQREQFGLFPFFRSIFFSYIFFLQMAAPGNERGTIKITRGIVDGLCCIGVGRICVNNFFYLS
jgi:hypothetical protein